MLNLGILRPCDYRPESLNPLDRLRHVLAGDRVSLQLLRRNGAASVQQIAAFEAIMHGQRLTTGIYRTTFHGRFRNVDPAVNELLKERFARDTPLQVHDWAASDCLASADWAATLFGEFPNATLAASDLTLFFLEIDLLDGTAFVIEREGGLLQYIQPPFVVDLNPASPDDRFFTRALVSHALARFSKIRPHLDLPAAWLDSNGPGSELLELPDLAVRKLPVVHPAAEALRLRNPRFMIGSGSVFDRLEHPADVIRTMNIYNFSYFPEDRLLDGARAVWQSLNAGGWWIVGRTWREDPPATNASLFEKTDAGFRLVQRLGEGSEIEGLVLANMCVVR